MNAAWVRRRSSVIQQWTDADPYLKRVRGFDFEVSREFLRGLPEKQKEMSEELRAFSESIDPIGRPAS